MVDARKVAVIGAGVAGLVAARELQSEGHRVVVFEKSDKVGGLWVYDIQVEPDKLDHDPSRLVVHSSIYQSLRTNLPRALMSFSGFPFAEREYGDPRKFPGHEEVLRYLNDFATCYGVSELTRFNSDVIRVERVEGRADRWVVEWQVKGEDGTLISQEEIFDAVVVCNGHCTVPRLAAIPGIEKWPGKQTHSHNYRIPEPFTDQVVVVIGNGASAYDISRDIPKVAKAVHVSSRSSDAKFLKLDHYHNMWHHSSISDAKEDGTVEFEDGSSVHASVIMHCSGYKHNFPFLNTNGIVSIDDNRVGPLYKHVFPPELAPWLSFVGLLQKTLIFDTMELQSKWIARALSGKVHLPAIEDMMADTREFFQQMTLLNRPKHLTHYLENSEEYLDYLAAQAGVPPLEDWRNAVFREILARQLNREGGFRDE